MGRDSFFTDLRSYFLESVESRNLGVDARRVNSKIRVSYFCKSEPFGFMDFDEGDLVSKLEEKFRDRFEVENEEGTGFNVRIEGEKYFMVPRVNYAPTKEGEIFNDFSLSFYGL